MRRTVGVAAVAALLPALLILPARALPAFAPPVLLPESIGVSEPGIDIGPAEAGAPGGAVWVNGPPGLGGASSLWVSRDGGVSYENAPWGPQRVMPGGGDSDVAIGPSGRVYWLDLWLGSNTFARSDDGGQSWSFASPLSTLAASDRQWMAVGGPGSQPGTDTLYIVYALVEPPQWVMVARSDDSGLTWTSHQTPLRGNAFNFTGQIVADATGFVGFVYHEDNVIRFARSTNKGASWTTRMISGPAYNTMPAVAQVGDTLHATWIGSSFEVMESHSSNKGQNWSTPRLVSAGGTNMFSWIDARGSKAAIAWYGTDGGLQDPNVNSGPWYLKYAESLDAGLTYSFPVKAVSAPIKTSPVCTFGLGCGTGGAGNRQLGDFLQLAVDLQGRSIVAYVDGQTERVYAVKQVS